MTGRDKALVLGDDTRSFLAISRSLGRRGIVVHAAPANFRSPALRSRYVSVIHDLPPWTGDGAEWVDAVSTLLRLQSYKLVIPCTETTLLPIQCHRAFLSQFAQLAIPDDYAIAVLFDKHRTRELAQEVSVPIARGRLGQPDDSAQRILTEFGAPVVLKPRQSYCLERLALRGKVEIVRERAQLDWLVKACDLKDTVIEQFFDGQGIGVSTLAVRGRVLQAFEHHRIHEHAGASFYRVSAPLTPDLVRACGKVIEAVGYTGIAMFEFKMNANGDWILLEVNARPWGSMPLPLALGIDFPYRWYRLLTAGEETPTMSYRTGVYGRNLLPDLAGSVAEAKRRKLRSVAMAFFLLTRNLALLRFLTGREVHDVLVCDDPRPGIIELLELGRIVLRRIRKLSPAVVARRRRRAKAVLAALIRSKQKLSIVFVCQGNICRSPFAAALLRRCLGDTLISIESSGIIPQTGRPAPALGVAAARAHNVDLSGHRSKWLTGQIAESASVLLVFDQITLGAIFDRYPNLKVPIILLGDLAGLGEFLDPIDGDAGLFAEVYDQIGAAISELSDLILESSRNVNSKRVAAA